MSFYADYLRESKLQEIIENEKGFVVFRLLPGTQLCYIETIYVAPQFRKQGVTKELESAVIEWARQYGCTGLMGSVNVKLSTPERSLMELLRAGYKLSHSNEEMIYFVKDIGVLHERSN